MRWGGSSPSANLKKNMERHGKRVKLDHISLKNRVKTTNNCCKQSPRLADGSNSTKDQNQENPKEVTFETNMEGSLCLLKLSWVALFQLPLMKSYIWEETWTLLTQFTNQHFQLQEMLPVLHPPNFPWFPGKIHDHMLFFCYWCWPEIQHPLEVGRIFYFPTWGIFTFLKSNDLTFVGWIEIQDTKNVPTSRTNSKMETHSLKLTVSKFASENGPGPKRKFIFQPSIFGCYVSFRDGILCSRGVFLFRFLALCGSFTSYWRLSGKNIYIDIHMFEFIGTRHIDLT